LALIAKEFSRKGKKGDGSRPTKKKKAAPKGKTRSGETSSAHRHVFYCKGSSKENQQKRRGRKSRQVTSTAKQLREKKGKGEQVRATKKKKDEKRL